MTTKEAALAAAEGAFQDSIKKVVGLLESALILARTPEEREHALEAHRGGLRRCKELHELTAAAIADVFA